MSFDVAPPQDLYTKQGVAVNVEAVAQIKVKSDPESILTAGRAVPAQDAAEREGLIRLVMEGHLRGIVGQLTVEEIVKQPEMVADRMRENVADDMDKMGLEVVSFTIKEVKRQERVHRQHGPPDIARIKREADIATAEAERDTAIKQAEAMREAAIARAQADQERVIAEIASQTQAGRGRARPLAEAGRVRGRRSRRSRPRPTRRTTSRPTSCSSRSSPSRCASSGSARGADQGPGGRDPAPRARARGDRAEGGRGRAAAHRDRWPRPSARCWRPGRRGDRRGVRADVIRRRARPRPIVIKAKGEAVGPRHSSRRFRACRSRICWRR